VWANDSALELARRASQRMDAGTSSNLSQAARLSTGEIMINFDDPFGGGDPVVTHFCLLT